MELLKVTIREATADDRSILFLLGEECLRPLAERAGHPERYDRDRLLAMLERAEVYVAESEAREVAGWVAFDEEAGEVEVRCFCVNPAFEAQRVANHLLDWVEGLAISRGRERLTAFVPAGDETSLHLYRRHDFVARTDAERPDRVALEKRLPER
jgi:ribosomal protein S18 acetylase RimI-like enzyme